MSASKVISGASVLCMALLCSGHVAAQAVKSVAEPYVSPVKAVPEPDLPIAPLKKFEEIIGPSKKVEEVIGPAKTVVEIAVPPKPVDATTGVVPVSATQQAQALPVETAAPVEVVTLKEPPQVVIETRQPTAKAVALAAPQPQPQPEALTVKTVARVLPKMKVTTADVRIADVLVRWARDSGYQVRWDASKHFLVDSEAVFEGSFETAVTDLLSTPGIRNSDYPLEVCFYPNNPPLARITRLGDQSRDCR